MSNTICQYGYTNPHSPNTLTVNKAAPSSLLTTKWVSCNSTVWMYLTQSRSGQQWLHKIFALNPTGLQCMQGLTECNYNWNQQDTWKKGIHHKWQQARAPLMHSACNTIILYCPVTFVCIHEVIKLSVWRPALSTYHRIGRFTKQSLIISQWHNSWSLTLWFPASVQLPTNYYIMTMCIYTI